MRKPICGPLSFHNGTSTGSTKAMASASNASKNVATPMMIRVRTCHHEIGIRSIRATTSSIEPPPGAMRSLIIPSPLFLLPSPLWGRAGVGGREVLRRRGRQRKTSRPPPLPSPNKLALGRAQARPGWGERKKLRRLHAQLRHFLGVGRVHARGDIVLGELARKQSADLRLLVEIIDLVAADAAADPGFRHA